LGVWAKVQVVPEITLSCCQHSRMTAATHDALALLAASSGKQDLKSILASGLANPDKQQCRVCQAMCASRVWLTLTLQFCVICQLQITGCSDLCWRYSTQICASISLDWVHVTTNVQQPPPAMVGLHPAAAE
jgi:hypothetical protein